MKKLFIPIVLLLMLFVGCNSNVVKVETYTISDSIFFENEYDDDYSYYTITVDIPITKNKMLRDNIINWILSDDSVKNDCKAYFQNEKDRFFAEEGNEPGSQYEGNYSLSEQTDKYVTYISEGYSYTGGAHTLPWYLGATFSKIDGSIIGYDLFEDPEQLTEIITKNIKAQYFKAYNTEEEEYFFDPEEIFPLPENEPWIETDSVVFCYGDSELETYSAGIPLCKIAWTDLKPYLSEKGKAFINE